MAEKKSTKKESSKEEKSGNERTYLVRYRLPGEKGRNPRKVVIQALNQSDAKKTALATIPSAEIVGGPKELDEGVLDFAGRVGKFMTRCAGKMCLAYARTPVNARAGTISQIRKQMTREIAKGTGERLVRAGGGEPDRVRITIKNTSSKRRSPRKRK